MQLKRFRGTKLADVMRQVREDLGPEAVILHTRDTSRRGLLRFVHGRGVEILAAVDHPDAGPVLPARRASPVLPNPTPARPGPEAATLQAGMAEIRDLLIRFGAGGLLPPSVAPWHARMVANGLDPALGYRLAAAIAELPAREGPGGSLEGALREVVADAIRVAAPPLTARSATVALVGPAGAGKTTTLAKLAARVHLAGGAVRLVGLDGSGLDGAGVLRALGRILGVPCDLALDPGAIARVLGPRPGHGLVLLDCPGVGPADRAGMAQLASLLRAATPGEVHLVLPATSKIEDARRAIHAATELGVTHLLFTRLDETQSHGSLVTLAVETGLPLSYLGTGREVPHDILPADPYELARLVLRPAREP